MIVYKDKTFCNQNTCKKFESDCHRALTPEVFEDALHWWNSNGFDEKTKNPSPPFMLFVNRPTCFEPKE